MVKLLYFSSRTPFFQVRVWGEQKNCLSKFTPYDGNAVDAVRYISAPQSTGRQFLLTGVFSYSGAHATHLSVMKLYNAKGNILVTIYASQWNNVIVVYSK